jgi:hypothetical protein
MNNSRVFTAKGAGKDRNEIIGIIILPDNTEMNVVSAAWSYAVRYTAKGLDVPDYAKAGHLMIERHPTWQFIKGGVVLPAAYNPELADGDTT